MKKLLLFGFLFIAFSALSQPVISTVYSENFDSINIKGTTYKGAGTGTAGPLFQFSVNNQLQVSPPNSYTAKPVAGTQDSIFFETDAFSTVGMTFARLTFRHIAKILVADRANIQISTNNGATWTTVIPDNPSGTPPVAGNVVYLGQSVYYRSVGYFNDVAYSGININNSTNIWDGPIGNTFPTNNWWVEEVFDISALACGATGFPQVKIRFMCAFPFGNDGNPNRALKAGWFIDNVKVEVSTCELYNPTATFTLGVSPPYNNHPQAGQFAPGNYPIGIRIQDNVRADSALLFYRINNGPWNLKFMIPDASQPVTNRIFRDTIFNLTVGDTVDYYIIGKDTCKNEVRMPSNAPANFYTFWIMPPPPGKCIPGWQPGNPVNPNIIYPSATNPWIESFESAEWVPGTAGGAGTTYRGTFPTAVGQNWTVTPPNNQAPNNYAWAIMGGNQPTTNPGTGPSGAQNGSKYVYTWGERGTTGQQTILETPCIQLPQDSCSALEFYYHMFGQNMGTIRVDIDTNSGTTSTWINGIFSISGQQHTSKTAPYTRAVVNIKPFTGKFVKFRFVATRGPGILSDIAIDNVRIYNPTTDDARLVEILKPVNGFCGYTATEDIQVRVQSLGCDTLKSIPIAFRINNGPIVWDTIKQNLITAQQIIYTLTPKANLSTPNTTYNIRVWTAVPGDVDKTNDTLDIQIINPTNHSTFPVNINFDGAANFPGNFTVPGNYGTMATTVWEQIPAPSGTNFSQYAWGIGNGLPHPIEGTGPFSDFSNYGNYLFARGNWQFNSPATLQSLCLNFNGIVNPVVSFYYYMFAPDVDSLVFRFLEDGGNNWITPPGGRIVNSGANAHTNHISPWIYREYSLQQFSNKFARVQIQAYRKNSGNLTLVAIDNLSIYNKIANDAGVENIQPPGLGVPAGTGQLPTFTLRNFGTSALTSIPVTYTITPYCGTGAGTPVTYNATWTGNLAPNQTVQFTPTVSPIWPVGRFKICASTSVTGDINTFNNEFCKDVTGFGQLSVPFFTNFDDCNWSATGEFSQGGLRQWELGTPAKTTINSAQSAPNAWITSRTRPYRNNAEEILRFPSLAGFDTIRFPEIRFAQNFQFSDDDGGVVEYETPQGWQILGELPSGGCNQNLGVNWYCTSPNFGTSSSALFGNRPAFTGSSGGWMNSSFPLNMFNFNPAPLNLRFRFRSNATGTGQGWAIDNLQIFVPPQNSAAPINVATVTPLIVPGINNQFVVTIQNTGAKRLDSCEVRVKIGANVGPWEKVIFPGNGLEVDQTFQYIYQSPWVSPASGSHNICAETRLPNGKPDNQPSDDEFCRVLVVLQELNIVQAPDSSFCNNFEGPNEPTWATYNAFTYANGTTIWEFGTPNNPPIVGAFSGVNAWMTRLDQNYRNRDSSALFTPVFIVDSNLVYEMSFMHYFVTEKFHDGGIVEVSQDGGNTWKVVGSFKPQTSWYNQPFITGLELINPGFTGNSDGWIEAKTTFDFQFSGKAIFRFRFGSDQNIVAPGWAIDDFCLKVSNARSEFTIGLDEHRTEKPVVGELYPNPASSIAHLPIYMPTSGNVSLAIYNLAGQKVFEYSDYYFEGRADVPIHIQGLRDGTYIVKAHLAEGEFIRKLIITSHR